MGLVEIVWVRVLQAVAEGGTNVEEGIEVAEGGAVIVRVGINVR